MDLPLPPDWKAIVASTAENKVCYWHKPTNHVQWVFPLKEAKAYQEQLSLKSCNGQANEAPPTNSDSSKPALPPRINRTGSTKRTVTPPPPLPPRISPTLSAKAPKSPTSKVNPSDGDIRSDDSHVIKPESMPPQNHNETGRTMSNDSHMAKKKLDSHKFNRADSAKRSPISPLPSRISPPTNFKYSSQAVAPKSCDSHTLSGDDKPPLLPQKPRMGISESHIERTTTPESNGLDTNADCKTADNSHVTQESRTSPSILENGTESCDGHVTSEDPVANTQQDSSSKPKLGYSKVKKPDTGPMLLLPNSPPPNKKESDSVSKSTASDTELSPPPIPARHYDSEDFLSQSSPPPVPDRTEESKILLQREPSTGREFGRYIVTDDGTRHFMLYDESMAYAQCVINSPARCPDKDSTSNSTPNQTNLPVRRIDAYDEIILKDDPAPVPDTPHQKQVASSKQKDNPNTFKPSTKVATPSTMPPHGQVLYDEIRNEPITKQLDKVIDNGASTISTSEQNGTKEESLIYDEIRENVLPPVRPSKPHPVTPSHEIPLQKPHPSSPKKHSAAEDEEDPFMVIDYSLQKKLQKKVEGESPLRLLKHHFEKGTTRSTPPLPPRRHNSVTRTKKDSSRSAFQKSLTLSSRRPRSSSVSKDDGEYDKLLHHHYQKTFQTLSMTLPRRPSDESGYSKLDKSLMMKAGLTMECSAMNGSQSSIENDISSQEVDEEPLQLIHAPNAPTAIIPMRPHDYEDLGYDERDAEEEPGRSTAKNDLDIQQKKKVRKTISAQLAKVIPKPETITDEDYERRLDRLENHYYPTLDIPAWPDVTSTNVNTKSTNEIKAVAKNSWDVKATPAKKGTAVNGDTPDNDGLPRGWKREVNEQGQVFYWHLPTGNIQYTRPTANPKRSMSKSTSPMDDPLSPKHLKPTTFAAHYYGSLDISEDRLVKGKCVLVVIDCLNILLHSTNPPHEVLYMGGLRREASLHLQIDGMDLKWLDTETGGVILTQLINRIRVWGTGTEDVREFGYIARNPQSQLHQCHVFRCDIAAMGIAQVMLDNHKVFKTRHASTTNLGTLDEASQSYEPGDESKGSVLVNIPSSSVSRDRSITQNSTEGYSSQGEKEKEKEKYKRMEATYLGCIDVPSPQGIKLLNQSIAELSLTKSKWHPIYIDIATSHIRLLNRTDKSVIKEHRVRFLAFLGIAEDDRFCGYVVDNGDNQFQFHGFECQPNADRLCLALHSACQARYQRVIDAHLAEGEHGNLDSPTIRRRKKSILTRIGSWKGPKSKDQDEESPKPTSQNFIVQYLGSEAVSKPKGVDHVLEPLQRLSTRASGIHLVELVVSPAGFTINDPKKKDFVSKHIPIKKITYCVRVRSHFVFIARESGKNICYMFSESEVDSNTIVTSVQQFMN